MKAINSTILHVVATAALVMSGFAQADDTAKAHTGKDQVELKHIHAVLQMEHPPRSTMRCVRSS